MTVLIDTDILIDIALKRENFFVDSSKIIELTENHQIISFIAWHSLSNFYYLTSSSTDRTKAKQFIADLLEFVKVAPVNTESTKKAISIETSDFEDALQISSAISCSADLIITRNIKHYKKSPIKAITQSEFIKTYNQIT